jgi:hypothetical protein
LVTHYLEEEPEIRCLVNHGVDDSEEDYLSATLDDSDRYKKARTVPRVVMIKPSNNLKEVLTQIEQRFGIPKEHLSLVSESHYLPGEGIWPNILQWAEIRIRGPGAGPKPKPRIATLPTCQASHWIDIVTEEEDTEEPCLGKELERKLTLQCRDSVKLYPHVGGYRQTVDRERSNVLWISTKLRKTELPLSGM